MEGTMTKKGFSLSLCPICGKLKKVIFDTEDTACCEDCCIREIKEIIHEKEETVRSAKRKMFRDDLFWISLIWELTDG